MDQKLQWIHHLSSAHQHPVAMIHMVSLTSARVKASGWLLTDSSVAWISLSSWGSITRSNASRQTSGHSSYSSAWSYHKPQGGRMRRGRRERTAGWGERLSRAQADWQKPLTQLEWSHINQCCVFFFSAPPHLLVWLTPECSCIPTEYWILHYYCGSNL